MTVAKIVIEPIPSQPSRENRGHAANRITQGGMNRNLKADDEDDKG